jgi:hypothetical protein
MVKGRARQHQEHGGPERAHHHAPAPSAGVHESAQRAVEGTVQDGSLLGDARLGGRGNGPVRAAVMQRMQQSVGNRALQRLLRSPSVTFAPTAGETTPPTQSVTAHSPSVQRTPDGQIAIQKASELDTTGAERFTTPSGKFYRFASVSSHKNSTNRPQFQHPATAMKAYSGAGSNGAALIHPAVSSALNTLMAALIAEGARLDDESMKQAVVDNGYRPSALSEGQAYLGALKKTIAQNPDIFGELTFPSSLESTATSELGFSGSATHNAFRDQVAAQPGWNANLAQQLVSITGGFKAPRGGSTHHSGVVVDINFPYATSDKSSKFHGIARENNANALRSAAGNWLNTFAPGFGFDSYDTGKEIWHMEWRDWSGTSADPKGATTPPPTPAAPSGGTGSAVQQMRAPVQRRAVRQAWPGMQHRPTLSRITPVQRDDPKPGWSNTGKGSSNAGEKQVGAIRRIPIEGLDVGNKSNDMDTPVAWEKDPVTEKPDKTKPKTYTRDKTKETAMKRAIVLVPDNLNTKDPIEVLLHLHGFGIGYRQPKGGGLSRDEDNDKTAAQLEAGKRNMIGVLPQGAYFSGFGNFNSDTYLTKVFARLIEMKILPEGTTPGRVIFSAHSGGGDRVTAMLGQKGTPGLPSNLAELVLFDGIHADGQANVVANWVTGHMDHDLAVLTDAQHAGDDARQREYLKSSMRFRGYHTAGGSYEKRYKIVKDALAKWFSDNETKLGGKSSTAYQGLALNYQVIPTGLPQGAKHDKMMGESGGFEESIKALDALPPPPATTGAPAVQKMSAPGSQAPIQRRAVWQAASTLQRSPASQHLTAVQRDDPKPGWSGVADTSPNKTTKDIGGIRRIPIEGLTQGNQDAAPDPEGSTSEAANGRAIVLIPVALLDPAKPPASVELLLHLHGWGIGWRTRSKAGPEKGMGAGTVRDEALNKIEAQLEASGRGQMMAVLPQGANKSQFGEKFNSDAYLKDVFDRLVAMKIWPAAPKVGNLVLAGHSGAGATLSEMLKDKSRLPSTIGRLAEVVLFDAINGPVELKKTTEWVLAQLDTEAKAIAGESTKEKQLDFVTNKGMRFRGYYTPKYWKQATKDGEKLWLDPPTNKKPQYILDEDNKPKWFGYGVQYEKLKADIDAWFAALEKKKVLDPEVFAKLRANYEVKQVGSGVTHEGVIGSGKLQEALGGLPSASSASPAPQPAVNRMPATQAPPSLQRQRPVARISVQRADPYSEEDAKKIKEKWEKEGAYTTSDTGEQKETRAYFAWKAKANKVLKPTKTLTKEKIDELKAWIAKYEAHELWALRSTGTEPDKPGNAPAELTALEVKKGVPLGAPPTPAYRKVTKYDVTMPGTKNAYSFKDDPVAPSYSNLRNETGVAKLGKKIGTRADIDKRFDDAGVTDATVRKVMKKVSTEEGGFEAVNTYDTGFISSGFIQFISQEAGDGSLSMVLREMKKSNATEFATYFHDLGIDVDDKGLIVVDPSQGKQLRGREAVKAVMNDKRLTAVFHQAGANSAAFQAAQIKTGYSEYYVADHSFTVKEGTVTISGKYGDVLKSEAGKTAIMDRGVQRGVPGTKEVFKKVCRDLIKAHKLTTLEELAKYEITIIASIQNRIKVLEDTDLSQPAAAPAEKPADKPAEEKK